MTRKFIAIALASTIALTSVTAAPARAADSGEIGRIILGAGALLIIGSALANQNNNRVIVTRRDTDVGRRIHRHNRKIAPAVCVRNSKWKKGPRRILTTNCLSKHMHNVARLPSACHRKIVGKNGARFVYGAHCLRQHGWSFG